MSAPTPTPTAEERAALEYLRSPRAIRERCANVLARGLAGELAHFTIDLERVPLVGARVASVTRKSYPTLAIPYHSRWNHFRAGGVARDAALPRDGRARVELAILSVLLDAGAGDAWRYREAETGQEHSRSEGLAVASLRMYERGELSGDAAALENMSTEVLARAFQVGDTNPLVGVEGRAELLRQLGAALRRSPALFGTPPRLGNLFDHLCGCARDRRLPAAAILTALLEGLAPIWPERMRLGGENLGDVWPHPAAGGSGPGAGLVPFHKLSQWLSYSLIEPLEENGIEVIAVNELTGLAEYRNGGLLVDLGVLVPRHPGVTGELHRPSSEVVVEWRALTVALLERVADAVRAELGVDRDAMPLAKVLEGGTWATGREVAKQRRPGGGPPIQIESDGTVF